jgi:alkylation response protein AidB-like acyl-CoA dehydrogenase
MYSRSERIIMDFQFTEEQQRFRQEVRDFLEAELPADWVDYLGTAIDDSVVHREDGWTVFQSMARKLGRKGWLSRFWPEEYGGQSCSYIEYMVMLEELARKGSPGYNAIGVKMLSPCIFKFGTPEQKARHLPLIAKGEEFWCEGFSEPDAGSDIASLKTRAVRDGDHYIINGQKTWGTFADHADWACVLTRTDPDQKGYRGLGFFMLDLSLPGINVVPIEKMHGDPDFSELFLEDVRIPADCLLGEENRGWDVVQTMLNYERIAIAPVAATLSMIERMTQYIQENPDRPWDNAREQLAKFKIEAEVGRLFCYRLASMHDAHAATPHDAALARYYGTSLFKRTATALMEILGLYGQLDRRDERAPLQGWFQHTFMSGVGITLAAGASEVLKNLVALLGLEMPRS